MNKLSIPSEIRYNWRPWQDDRSKYTINIFLSKLDPYH
jgi:hypothetical protein